MKQSWELKKLSEVCENLDSKRIPITKNKRVSGNIPYYGASGIVDYVADYLFNEDLLLVSEDGANLLARTYPIAFSIEGKTWVNNHAHVLRFDNLTNQHFIEYFLNSIKLDSYISGMAQPKLNQKSLNSIIVPFPPLEEQQRIVAILDEAFELIEQAQANINKNIENAQELFQSKLNDIFSQTGEGWEEKKIIELCNHKSQIVGGPFGSNLKVKDYKDSGVPILRLQNIGKGYFIDKDIKYVSNEKAKELEYHSFVSGDIVLAKLGIPIGKTCIVPEDFPFGIVVADVVRIRPNKDEVDYDFLKHFLNSDASVNQLSADIRGATRPRVNISEVRNLQLSVPSTEKQVEIKNYIDELEVYRNDLIAKYERKLNNLEDLKKSILEKAFAGELTNKDR